MELLLKIVIICFITFFISACTTTNYSRVEPDGTLINVDHFSIGMEREDIHLNFAKKPGDLKIGVNIGRSSGKESFDRVISGLESTLETLKSMRP